MREIIEYLVKLSVGLALVWLLYRLVLRQTTFYQWNRFYLAGLSLAFFLLPLIDVTSLMESSSDPVSLVAIVPSLEVSIQDPVDAAGASTADIFIAVFLAGIGLRLYRLARQWHSLQQLKKKAVRAEVEGTTLYDVDGDISPFSFAGAVFLNSRLHTGEELQKIIRHEFVHVQQKHSLDLLVAEIICVVNWFNPFAWLIRKSIRQNLEFIANHTVLQSGVDVRQYQYLLLKVVGVPGYSLSTNFNLSSLKKRIIMINKNRTPRITLVRFLLILPVLVLALLAFRQKNPAKPLPVPSRAAKPAASPVAAATGSPQPVKTVSPSSGDGASRVSQAEAMSRKAVVAVTDTVPVVDPPPPPPSPSVDPPVIDGQGSDTNGNDNENGNDNDNDNNNRDVTGAGIRRVIPVKPHVAKPAAVPATPSKVAPVARPVLPDGVKGIHQKDKVITVVLKTGKKETYHLDKPEQKKSFEKKYGSMPVPPSPPLKPVKE